MEELTWSSSLETFANHLRNERINKDCKIFINSISNQILSTKKIDELEKEYSKYLKNVVLEVTEVEYIDENYHQQKAELMKKWQAELALDDYGSGYNSDRILLLISPKFIKIDMDIIRNIDSDPDKCKIVENIVNYAHERDMKLIAEGIETIDELKQVIKLKVDYLQGFLLAKPQYLPPRIQEDVIKLIQLLNEK
ncbi:EAL domain-containing protein [Thomasclavelia ramosa]|uniref:EAL domain-containing protein n=1 Tax=Thomasclavelia ramosa TaxID=1547 RepID=UPI004068EA86